ncbi:hypothetical protein VCR15J2_330126 [Vibrio coralliirubri]|nr:hypothetical protein VCR15J2_330126 [Vibrio coralliirubri]
MLECLFTDRLRSLSRKIGAFFTSVVSVFIDFECWDPTCFGTLSVVTSVSPPSYIRQIPIDLLDYGADTELLSLSNVQIYI